MAPGSQAPPDLPAGRSGGKILKGRRTAARKTPYDRPNSPQPQPPILQPESPSWLSGLVLPAKFVAGGATKILSSFWNPKNWGAPSSSSSDSDSGSEDDSGDDENLSDSLVELNQKKGSSSEKSETLRLIEQLLMLEHYSREECDRLTEIIDSRVVDYSMRESVAAGPSMTNNETADIHSQAIMEAKKWVAEKKVRSDLKSDLDNGIYALKSAMTPQTAEAEAGSPIDVAKSYMRARPPWASPINHDNSLTPSPLAADFFKERTPYSSGGGASFQSTKRDYLSAGSWNIQDEIRRLRSKATEDMLNSHRSVKLALSTLDNDHDTPNDLLVTSADETVNLASDGVSNMRTAQTDLPTEALPSDPTMSVLEQYKDMDSMEMIKGQGAAPSSGEGNKLGQENDRMIGEVEKSCYMMTQVTEIPVVNNSQSSSNTNKDTTETRAVTRASRNSQRGKAKGK